MRRLARAWVFAALLLAAASIAPTAEPSGAGDARRISLREAVERAREESPTLGSLKALETAAEAQRDAEAGARRPVIDAAVSYERRSHVEEFIVRPAGLLSPPVTVFPDIPDRYRSHLGVTVPLYTGGRIDSAVAAAERWVDVARDDSESGRADLDLGTTLAYWDLVVARERVSVVQSALGTYEAHLADSRNRASVGVAAASEVLAVQVTRDRADFARVRAEGEAEVARAELGRRIGAPSARLEPSESLVAAELVEGDEETLVQEALAARPERRAILGRAEAAAARATQIRAALKPQLAAGGSYDFSNPNSDVFPLDAQWQGTWRVDVGARFLLTDGGVTRSRAAAMDAEALAVRHEIAELDRSLRTQVVRGLTGVTTAAAALEVAGNAVRAAEENVRVSRDRFREGLLPSSELLDAETGLLLAQLERVEAIGGSHRARASLVRALGRPLP